MTPSRPVPPIRGREEAKRMVAEILGIVHEGGFGWGTPNARDINFISWSKAERIVDALLGQPNPENYGLARGVESYPDRLEQREEIRDALSQEERKEESQP